MYDTIYEQLQTSCDCIKLSDKNDENFKKNIDQLIDLISIITCWKNSPCENFLSSDREEVMDVDVIKSCWCDGGLMIVPLYYRLAVRHLRTRRDDLQPFYIPWLITVVRIE